MTTELATIDKSNVAALFVANGFDPLIEKIRAEVKSKEYDISTPAGRAEIKSVAFKVVKSRTAIDKAGKELGAEYRDTLAAINAERKRACEELEALETEVRAPLTEWENRDKIRIAAHEASITDITALAVIEGEASSAFVQQRIDALTRWHNYDWEEFAARAKQAQDAVTAQLQAKLASVQRVEAERAELERLRAAEAARIQKEREDKIASEAAEKARLEAERIAKAEQERVEAEARAIQQATERKAIEAAEKAENERKRVELAARAAEERAAKAEADRIAAEAKAKADAIAAAEAAEKAAKERERIATEAERKRLEDIAAKEAAETAKREADKAHRAKINGEALAELQKVIDAVDDRDAEILAKAIITAIAKGQIPNVRIGY